MLSIYAVYYRSAHGRTRVGVAIAAQASDALEHLALPRADVILITLLGVANPGEKARVITR